VEQSEHRPPKRNPRSLRTHLVHLPREGCSSAGAELNILVQAAALASLRPPLRRSIVQYFHNCFAVILVTDKVRFTKLLITDRLGSYASAFRRLRLACPHEQGPPPAMFTPIFAVARTVGWVAHWNEMVSDPETRLFRPRQLYAGPVERSPAPIAERKAHAPLVG
jgi:hypothetical protein